MTALAWRALRETPALADRLRDRFPLVIFDEAQDTHGDQLRLLEHVFKHNGAAFQRLGDSSQTLYEDDGAAPAYWTPAPDCIPLDTSRRFGGEIAGFASRLTARRTQTIVGLGSRPASRVMFLFDEATIGGVLGAFAEEARALWGGDCGRRDVWAVASRHNLPGKKGEWQPKSLVDYHPAVGISGLARAHSWKATNDRPITAHNIWPALSHRGLALLPAVRRLLRDHLIAGTAVWEEAAWEAFMEALLPLFGPPPKGSERDIADLCAFLAEQKADLIDPERRSTKQVQFDDLMVRLGSIHSVKAAA
ncbi:UvrD-helicase domain-containing protein (plasmid) [Rhizobium leguminosarum]